MSKKILVVDDEKAIVDLVKRILEAEHYSIFSAHDGRKGITIFDTEDPDLVITDVIMPDMEGIEFITTLRKKKSEVRIIVMSGNIIGINFLETAKVLGAKATLTKPFTPRKLLETVVRVLED